MIVPKHLFTLLLIGNMSIPFMSCKTATVPLADDYLLIIHQDEIMGFHGYKYTIGNGWLRIEAHNGFDPTEKANVLLEKRLSANELHQLYRFISTDSFYQQPEIYRCSTIDGFYRHIIEVYSGGRYKKITLFDQSTSEIDTLFLLLNGLMKHSKWHLKMVKLCDVNQIIQQ